MHAYSQGGLLNFKNEEYVVFPLSCEQGPDCSLDCRVDFVL